MPGAEGDYGLRIVVMQVFLHLAAIFAEWFDVILIAGEQILVVLTLKFPAQLAPFLSGIVPQAWSSLVESLKMFVYSYCC